MRLPPFRTGFLRQLKLEGARVTLRPMRSKDWRQWSRLRATSRHFLTPWEPIWPADALTRGAYRQRLKISDTEGRGGHGYTLHIFRREDEALMGAITLTHIRRGVAQMGTLGYWIGEPYARQGYMTEALELVARFAFRDLGLHRLEAACLPGNQPSQRLLRRLGFREEGLARSYLRIDGQWADHLLFARLSDDVPLRLASSNDEPKQVTVGTDR
ncbi:MAG: GNAT family N-acetyltransferase [Rhodospirillales bacterium]|nr:GNAT family N-acetyltransferase [Rhodospirillales bacterium]